MSEELFECAIDHNKWSYVQKLYDQGQVVGYLCPEHMYQYQYCSVCKEIKPSQEFVNGNLCLYDQIPSLGKSVREIIPNLSNKVDAVSSLPEITYVKNNKDKLDAYQQKITDLQNQVTTLQNLNIDSRLKKLESKVLNVLI